MVQYDKETLHPHALYEWAVLLQIACDTIMELTSITGSAEALEPLFDQIAEADLSNIVVSTMKGSTPIRMKLARQLTRTNLRAEVVPALRIAAMKGVEKSRWPKN